MPWNEITFSEWIQIIVSVISLVGTIVVSILIFWMQMRHEKEIMRLESERQKRELEEKARIFLIEHEEEKGYLPWCLFASNLHRMKRHFRRIYIDYCRCSPELQKEIMRQAGFEVVAIDRPHWVQDALKLLRKDIENYDLGESDKILYDGAKYLHRGYGNYYNCQWIDMPNMFKPIYKPTRVMKALRLAEREKVSIGEYIDEYIRYHQGERRMLAIDHEPFKPVWYMLNKIEFSSTEEAIACAGVMELVEAIANRVPNGDDTKYRIDCTDALVETFEDKYYSVMQSLYNSYYGLLVAQ